MAGLFITLEGIDGAGKSTHVDFIQQWLRARGHAVVTTREPGGTPLGERLRGILLGDPMHVDTETLLIFAARSEHLQQVVRPALAAGSTVLCDRFTDATFAYQCGGRGVAESMVEALARMIHPGLQPELTLLFDTEACIARDRVLARSASDRFEREGLDFFEGVRQRYLEQAQREPGRFCVLDAGRSVLQVQAAIADAIAARLSKVATAAAAALETAPRPG